MIGLTARLNERDETIIQLQNELDRMEAIQNNESYQPGQRDYLITKRPGRDYPARSEPAEV